MKEKLYRINDSDNVAVALSPLKKNETVSFGKSNGDCAGVGTSTGEFSIILKDDIPAGHKAALMDIKPQEQIIKYGFPIGRATTRIEMGRHVHTHNVMTTLDETPEYHYNFTLPQEPERNGPVPDIEVFHRLDGRIGIRNEIWIIPTVGCVNKTAEILASWATKEFAGKGIDGVYAWTHPYGCSQIDEDLEKTKTILANLAKHPNAAAVLILSLGCENNTLDSFKQELGCYAADRERIAFLVTQDCTDELEEGKALLAMLAKNARKAQREKAKITELIVGMKCGGSDGFSGITANPLLGRISDALCGMGASVILTEVPEMFGAEQALMNRCETREMFDKIVSLISDFKAYYRFHNQPVYENPSPGNKAGGISTLEDKSCGCIQKGGTAPVKGVYRYGQQITAGLGGLALLDGPGNDLVSTTAMTAAGAHLILFTTGRGTPLGAPVPTVKISSNSELAKKKPNWIDFDSGCVFDSGAEILSSKLMELIADIASGRKKVKNELNGYREIAVFKNGVTL